MAPSVSSMDSGKTPIEPAEGTPESDEFDFVSDWDKLSIPPRDAGSNVWQHVYEGGRRYHLYKHGRYPIPNDETEQDREDMKHAMMMELCDGKLFYAPIGDFPKKIMDIGTGTGIWAIEVGDLFPDAEILGTDLSPIQPEWVPQNVRFMVDDCEDDWLNGFGWDFVHLRQMSGMVRNIEKVILQSFEHIKPGGWIELQDLHVRVNCDDGSMPIDDPLKRFYTIVFEALAKQGLDCDKPKNLRHTLERAGFVNIQCVRKKVPIGVWAKDPALRIVGHYMKTAILDVIPALAGKPFEDIQVSKVESAVWLAKLRQSLEDTNVHRYFTFFFWFAQKPLP